MVLLFSVSQAGLWESWVREGCGPEASFLIFQVDVGVTGREEAPAGECG